MIGICWLGALLIGLGLNELGAARAINVLSAPILVLILWNVCACLIGALGLLFTWRASVSQGPVAWLSDVLHLLADRLCLRRTGNGRNVRLAFNCAHEFLAKWFSCCRPLHVSQVHLVLHGLAAALVVGAVGGMYLRGFAFEYEATWESTFLDADTAQAVLGVVLAPASAILGDPVPDVAAFEAMKAKPVPAAMWIHRYALTTLLFVIVPRLALACIDLVRLRRLRRAFPLDWRSDQYFLRLVAPERGQGVVAEVQPYSFNPSERSLAALKRQLQVCFGNMCDVTVAPGLEYGQEITTTDTAASDTLADQPDAAPARHRVLLFNLAQTPEQEVHGRLVAEFVNLTAGGPGRLLVLIDQTAFRGRHGGGCRVQ